MQRLLYALLVLLGLNCGCSKSTGLSEAEFGQEVAVALRQASPGLKVEAVHALELKLTTSDGKESTFFLDNAYGLFKKDPAAKDDVIRKYVAATLETTAKLGSTEPIDPSRIVPVIKDRQWLRDIQLSLVGRSDKKLENVFEDYNEDLVIVYAEDTPKNIQYVSPGDLAKLHIERSELRKFACENLKKLLPPVELKEGDGFYQVTAGGDYDASLLLMDDVWEGIKKKLQGEVVIAVPARNALAVTGSDNKTGIAKMKQITEKFYASDPYHLTPKLFILRAGKFEEFKP